ncbi:DNA-binding protein, 42 kDa [Rhinocladiella mackenziei CBS 650.93]|uniref:DNA-binding protein, 42 kDa n=1 Tax=Rhinocladiella mackenziei CBS 650.93 TaxID=1442369 RepID=A0A0D2FNV2_9EURO|nr:DNA-binding protein, 42 kDa [Rhinocladiella mackenziei CBS 650.93]KIX03777.1 DNA-binding protein, 42 kDa [Rhinocladiella mackenziei CBS 650.93]
MAESAADPSVDQTISNVDVLTKFKTAAGISQKVLEEVSGWCVAGAGAKIVELCERGDKLLADEIAKVYKTNKCSKGPSSPVTISPSSYVTPFTPLISDAEDAAMTLKPGELVKVQLGAQIDGFGAIVGNTVVVNQEKGKKAEITGREADLLLATHYANELLLRLMVPPGLLASGSEEEKKKAAAEKPPTQTKIISLVEKVAKAYDVHVVQHTTSWLFERSEIEGKKKIILSPADGAKGEGSVEVGEVWGVEMGLSLGSGKVKELDKRSTLLRRTTTTYGLKRPSSRQVLSEIVKKFGTFPFSLRQLDDEKAGKVGVVECIRSGVLREYKPAAEADGSPVSRLFTTIAITKNGITRLAAPPALDLESITSDKKIEDEEILKILERPISKSTGGKSKNKKKKKKPAKKAVAEEEDDDEDEDSDDE